MPRLPGSCPIILTSELSPLAGTSFAYVWANPARPTTASASSVQSKIMCVLLLAAHGQAGVSLWNRCPAQETARCRRLMLDDLT